MEGDGRRMGALGMESGMDRSGDALFVTDVAAGVVEAATGAEAAMGLASGSGASSVIFVLAARRGGAHRRRRHRQG